MTVKIAFMIFGLFGVPVVVLTLFVIVGDVVRVLVEQIESCGAILAQRHCFGSQAQQLDLSAFYGNARLGAVHAGAESSRMVQIDGTVAQIYDEIIVFAQIDVEIGDAFAKVGLRNFTAGIAQRQARKFKRRIWRETDGAAVFQLDFDAAIVLGPDAHALCDRQIPHGLLKAFASAAIDLHLALNVAQADDPSLRVG